VSNAISPPANRHGGQFSVPVQYTCGLFLVEKLTLRHVVYPVIRFFAVSIIPHMVQTQISFTDLRQYIILAAKSVFK